MSSTGNPDSAVSQVWPDELDALVAAPRHHRCLFENSEVRVIETRVPPGDRVPVHTHRWPAVHHVLTWSAFIRRAPDGTVLSDTRQQHVPATPFVQWSPAQPPHDLENVGDTDLLVVSVEVKDPRATESVAPD